ncbi:glycosyltransferase family 4 protein [Aurantimicrobium minutum]|uniref:glycosyltransferase family 4 protein n=1 Tax=Aurantimicrobium minutum TaxID=708131 RepID=UPI00247351EC|nr:glycosyltransferase family 1 protein [Aurantimicrobium minutum]MDH6208379.1 glycosyltransferase involved in cell wall biosynthesis [Aurantimicrobium minutum]
MAQGTLWIDVTDLTTWTGNLTGIQRTHFHLGQEFAKQPGVKFFAASYDKGIKEVGLPTAESFEEKGKKPGFREQSAFAKYAGKGTRFANRVIHKVLPGKLSRAFDRFAAGINGTVSDFVFGISEKREKKVLHPFTSEDTVLILGATWGTPDFPELLCSLKREVGFKLIFTVYDLIPVYAPHFFGPGFGGHYSRYLMNTISASDALLSISQHTTKDLKHFMNELLIPVVPIINFRLGDNPLEVVGEHGPSADIEEGNFVLAVGTVEVRKNHQALYLAWELAAKEGIELPPLVIVGKPGWNVSDLLYDISANPLVNKKIKIVSGIDDATLGWLYNNCLMTVYPSWYEGWGLPVAESLHFGKVCISSSASSMPEIGGDLVDYCSPYEPRAFMNKIYEYALNPELLKKAEKRIDAKYRSVTWEESFQEIWNGLEKLS